MDLEKWIEEKESNWKAGEADRKLKQDKALAMIAAPPMEDQIAELQKIVKVLQDKLGVANV